MSSAGLSVLSLANCVYAAYPPGYPCNYNNMVSGEGAIIPDTRWYRGFVMKKGAKLYHGGLPTLTPWWRSGPPQGELGPFFTTVIRRASELKGYVLEYNVRQDTPLIYTGPGGGKDTQYDVFQHKQGFIGYFSCKECEISVRNGYVDKFVDWQNVRDITSLVLGSGESSTAPSSPAPTIVSGSPAAAASSASTTSRPKLKKE